MKNIINEKKGITYLVLVITIVLLLIVLASTTITFNNITVSAKQRSFANEIYAVQKVVEEYNFINGKYPLNNNKINLDLYTIRIGFREQFIAEPGYNEGKVVLQEINLSEAGVENVTKGTRKDSDETDIYVVSEATGKVYYLKGEQIGGKLYYGLTDKLKQKLEI